MPAYKFTLLFGVLFVSLIVSNCRQNTSVLPRNVVNSIEKRIDYGINPSIAIGVIDENGTHFFNFGKKSAQGLPVDEHTIYEIGSITKTFTATLLANLVVEGKVNLSNPINQFLPADIRVPFAGPAEITLGNLSDHTSGLPRMPDNFHPANPNNPYADYSVEQMYAFITSYRPIREPGSDVEYSNLAQGLLGHLLALHAGLPYEDLMLQTIAAPLGMEQTKITLDQKMLHHLAVGHSQGAETENWDIPTLAGAGAIRSSTSDMLKFIAANLGYKETTLRPAMDLTHQARQQMTETAKIGLGWIISEGKKGDVIWHNGGTGGYRAFAGFVKESGKGVVILTNSSVSIDDIGFHLLDPGSELKEIKRPVATDMANQGI